MNHEINEWPRIHIRESHFTRPINYLKRSRRWKQHRPADTDIRVCKMDDGATSDHLSRSPVHLRVGANRPWLPSKACINVVYAVKDFRVIAPRLLKDNFHG